MPNEHLLSAWMDKICTMVPREQTVLSMTAVRDTVVIVTTYAIYQAKSDGERYIFHVLAHLEY